MAEPAAVELATPLPPGTVLHEFRIERVIGEGGFGIVYLARDLQLERTVALKEYMPSSLATRQTGFGVGVRSERHRETFELGLRSFVNEAKLLASFDHASLVKVYRFWEQNGTAFMVMPYYEGPTLKAWLKQQPQPPGEDWLKRLLHPLLDALELIHADRCYHRDIAPDNILLLGPMQRPLLLDFGAARRVIGDATQALTTILKPGYAPIEQYAEVPSMKQGAWTDVYALCAVLYAALTGRPPMPAVGRMMKDELVPVAQCAAGRYSPEFLRAIDEGLALRPEQRPQSIAALRERLFEQPVRDVDATILRALADGEKTVVVPTVAQVRARAADDATVIPTRTERVAESPPASPPVPTGDGAQTRPPPASKAGVFLVAAMAGLAIVAGAVWFFTGGEKKAPIADVSRPPAVDAPASAAIATADPIAVARPAFSPQAVLDEIVRQADRDIVVRAVADKDRLAIGRDRMSFRVTANQPGYLYVFLSGTEHSNVALLFPNAIDQDNRIVRDTEVVLPRKGWQITAGGPPGTNHLVAMVSREPRDFSNAGLKMGETIPEFELAVLQRAWGVAGPAPGAGETRCPSAAPCDARYGAGAIRIDEFTAK
jgi:hypothetical protein